MGDFEESPWLFVLLQHYQCQALGCTGLLAGPTLLNSRVSHAPALPGGCCPPLPAPCPSPAGRGSSWALLTACSWRQRGGSPAAQLSPTLSSLRRRGVAFLSSPHQLPGRKLRPAAAAPVTGPGRGKGEQTPPSTKSREGSQLCTPAPVPTGCDRDMPPPLPAVGGSVWDPGDGAEL